MSDYQIFAQMFFAVAIFIPAFWLGYRLGGLGERELHYKEMARLYRWPLRSWWRR